MSNRISEEARKLILDDLVFIGSCSGGQYVAEFVKRVFPDVEYMYNKQGSRTVPVLNEIARHMDTFNDWDFNDLFDSVLKLTEVSDEKFIRFLEQYVHPIFRRYDEENGNVDLNQQCIEAINRGLSDVGLQLSPVGTTAGRMIYKAISDTPGVQYPIKNIIFAAKYKPDLVIDDALSNDIRIVDSNSALVYDQGIPSEGIKWERLLEWYKDVHPINTEEHLISKFETSLDSDVEKQFFHSYIKLLKEEGSSIPALIPQVYMYYDPKTKAQREWSVFEHQKMDFMMIISPTQRVVIEIDGQQHYAEDNNLPGTYKRYASPTRYADMMKAHREMTLAGYDVYRFGGKELCVGELKTVDDVNAAVLDFFKKLFLKYQII